jgi:hypothetical protein
VPEYLRIALPENVIAWRNGNDDATGVLHSVTLASREWIDDELVDVERTYTTTGWQLRKAGGALLAEGEHAFGECPVLVLTETGAPFPVLGKYEQIARLSRRVFNARSELDEILRSQTFSVLTYQVTEREATTFNPQQVTATLGTSSMLMHQGDGPAFIAPDAAPAQTYMQVIDQLRTAISRIAMDDINAPTTLAAQESGAARRMRFDAMNAELAAFALKLQRLEGSIWRLFHRAIGTENRVVTTWPTDFNLADVAAELDILSLMQSTSFPAEVLAEKKKAVAAIEFDNADDDTKARLLRAIDEEAQSAAQDPTLTHGDLTHG